jgi:hypothetical protein
MVWLKAYLVAATVCVSLACVLLTGCGDKLELSYLLSPMQRKMGQSLADGYLIFSQKALTPFTSFIVPHPRQNGMLSSFSLPTRKDFERISRVSLSCHHR